MKIIGIVQARMSSHRLPGKVMRQAMGKPMLQYLLERISRCTTLEMIVVATSENKEDDAIADFCQELGYLCVRGSLNDVAGRFHTVLYKHPSYAFVRINGDSPLMDPDLVDSVVRIFQSGNYDLVTNTFPRTFPTGQSVEILNSRIYLDVYRSMSLPEDKEHVTRYYYTHSEQYRILNHKSSDDYSDYHLSVDTEDDFKQFCSTLLKMEKEHWHYHLKDLIALYPEERNA